MDTLQDGSLKLELDDVFLLNFAFDMCPDPLRNPSLEERLSLAAAAMSIGLFLESGEREAIRASLESVLSGDGEPKIDPRVVIAKAGLEGAATIVPVAEIDQIRSLYHLIPFGDLDHARAYFEQELSEGSRGKGIGKLAAKHFLRSMEDIFDQLGHA